MKNGRKPTLKQMKIMQQNNMNSDDWFVCKILSDHLLCEHRHTLAVKKAFYQVMVR